MKENKLLTLMDKHPYICLNTMVLITGLLLYSPFIFGQYIFAYSDWGYDNKHAFIPFYEYYVNKFAEGRIGSYDFSFGLGTSSFDNIYNLAEPFGIIRTLIGILFGSEKIGYLLIYIHFLKNILLGCLGMCYLKTFKFSNVTSIISSYVLSFSGYVMVTGQHYSFSSYAVIFMFIIVMFEKTIINNRWWLGMAISIAMQGLMGPYTLFQTLIALGIYVLVRVLQVKGIHSLKNLFITLSKFAGVILIGLMLSMVTCLPQCYAILCISQRVPSAKTMSAMLAELFSLLPNEYIKTGFLRLFSNNLQGLINSWEGGGQPYFSTTPYFFSLFFPLCITWEVVKIFDREVVIKQKMVRIFVMSIMAIAFFLNSFSLLSNMFAYVAHRWVFVLLPVFLFCMADALEDLFHRKKWSVVMCLVSAVLYIFIMLKLFNSKNKYSVLSLKFTIIIFILVTFLTIVIKVVKNERLIRVIKVFLFACIAFSQFFDSMIGFYVDRAIMTKEEYSTNYHMPYMQEFKKVILDLEGDNFIRMDRTFVGSDGSADILYSFICPMRTVSVYNSTLNKYTIEFVNKLMHEVAVTQIGYALNSYGVWYNTHIADLLGIKYIVSQQKTEHSGWNLISEFEGYYLYQNTNMETAGLLYDYYITADEYEGLDNESQAIVTTQAVILDNNVSTISKKTVYNYDANGESVQLLTIEENELKQVELCIIDPVSDGDNGFITLQYNGAGSYILQNEQREMLYVGNLMPLGEQENAIISVTPDVKYCVINLGEDMSINYDNIRLCSYNNNYNNECNFINFNMGNIVEGNVITEKEKFLFMPIPYEHNWKAYVNGEKVEVWRADYGFMGILIPEGENNIQFVYYNYPFYIGSTISLIGMFICVVIVFLDKKKKTRKYKSV